MANRKKGEKSKLRKLIKGKEQAPPPVEKPKEPEKPEETPKEKKGETKQIADEKVSPSVSRDPFLSERKEEKDYAKQDINLPTNADGSIIQLPQQDIDTPEFDFKKLSQMSDNDILNPGKKKENQQQPDVANDADPSETPSNVHQGQESYSEPSQRPIPKKDQIKGAERLVDFGIGLHNDLYKFAGEKLIISEEKLQKMMIDGRINRQMLHMNFAEDSGNDITLMELIHVFNQEIAEVTDAENREGLYEKIRPALIDECIKRNWYLSNVNYVLMEVAKQTLMDMVKLFVAKGGMNSAIKAAKSHWADKIGGQAAFTTEQKPPDPVVPEEKSPEQKPDKAKEEADKLSMAKVMEDGENSAAG